MQRSISPPLIKTGATSGQICVLRFLKGREKQKKHLRRCFLLITDSNGGCWMEAGAAEVRAALSQGRTETREEGGKKKKDFKENMDQHGGMVVMQQRAWKVHGEAEATRW